MKKRIARMLVLQKPSTPKSYGTGVENKIGVCQASLPASGIALMGGNTERGVPLFFEEFVGNKCISVFIDLYSIFIHFMHHVQGSDTPISYF
jgi:hypothetical protein